MGCVPVRSLNYSTHSSQRFSFPPIEFNEQPHQFTQTAEIARHLICFCS